MQRNKTVCERIMCACESESKREREMNEAKRRAWLGQRRLTRQTGCKHWLSMNLRNYNLLGLSSHTPHSRHLHWFRDSQLFHSLAGERADTETFNYSQQLQRDALETGMLASEPNIAIFRHTLKLRKLWQHWQKLKLNFQNLKKYQ